MKKTSLPAARKPIGLTQISRGSAMRVLLIFQCLALVTRADISKQQLQKWVDDSTLVFTGTIVELGRSNVGSIEPLDAPMIVRIDRVEWGKDDALKKFGSWVGKELTVVLNPGFKAMPKLKAGIAAVFFVDPFLYETNIAVTANAIADKTTASDLSKQLAAAVEQKRERPLSLAVKSANLIVTGVVQEIRPLPNVKIDKLRSLANGRDLYSEHSPRWREAVIRGHDLKGDEGEKTLLVIFPSTGDLMWANAPKFKTGQSGIWLLHRGAQLADDVANILLTPEQFHGQPIRAYTALQPEDFQPNDPDGKNEARIREIVKSLKP